MIILAIRKRSVKLNVLVSIEDVDVIKGVSACFVILAHESNALQEAGIRLSLSFRLLEQLGGLGVLIFFFLSGYGIYKKYGRLKPGYYFLSKRVRGVIFPYLVIKICFMILNTVQGRTFTIKYIIAILLSDWFIDVILIQYILFYISWILKNTVDGDALIKWNYFFNILLGFLFIYLQCEARWYNGLLLFPTGMLFAEYEDRFVIWLENSWKTILILSAMAFVICSCIFVMNKGMVWTNIFKSVAGIMFCILLCSIFREITCNSIVLRYIGKRSLYYYVIHVNLMSLLRTDVIVQFYITIVGTVLIAEILYRCLGEKFATWTRTGF